MMEEKSWEKACVCAVLASPELEMSRLRAFLSTEIGVCCKESQERSLRSVSDESYYSWFHFTSIRREWQ